MRPSDLSKATPRTRDPTAGAMSDTGTLGRSRSGLHRCLVSVCFGFGLLESRRLNTLLRLKEFEVPQR